LWESGEKGLSCCCMPLKADSLGERYRFIGVGGSQGRTTSLDILSSRLGCADLSVIASIAIKDCVLSLVATKSFAVTVLIFHLGFYEGEENNIAEGFCVSEKQEKCRLGGIFFEDSTN